MSYSLETGQLPLVQSSLLSIKFSNDSLTERVAVGIRSYPNRNVTTWFVLDILGGAIATATTSEIDKSISVETACSALIGISGLLVTWCGAADEGMDGLLKRVADLHFFVAGDAPVYIKNLASVVELMSATATSIRAQASVVQ